MSAQLHQAYDLARAGIKVHPVYGMKPDGTCQCGGQEKCSPGKHPITPRGYLDATDDMAKIREWWTRWPHASIGIALAASGLVDVAPDSAEWAELLEGEGLPSDVRYTSGGGEGHYHVLFRRPEGCPTVRINRSGEYDIQSDGYSIAPTSTHKSGRTYEWINGPPDLTAIPEAPAWIVERLKARAMEVAAKKERAGERADMSAIVVAGGEPPVNLDADALAIWRGERVKTRPDGNVDRSASLLLMGRTLYDAGANRPVIVPFLRERDHALGFHKFCCDRGDGEAQYHGIVDELESKGRNTPGAQVAKALALTVVEDTGDGEEDAAGGDESERFRRMRHQRDVWRFLARQMLRVVGEAALSPTERITAVFTGIEVHQLKAAGRANERGEVPLYVPGLAEKAGLSVSTLNRNLKSLTESGWGVKRTTRVQQREPGGPVAVGEYKSQLLFTPDGESVGADLVSLIAVAQARPPKISGPKTDPDRCDAHPEAAVIALTTLVCGECGEVIAERPPRVVAKALDVLDLQIEHSEIVQPATPPLPLSDHTAGDAAALNRQSDVTTTVERRQADNSGEPPAPASDWAHEREEERKAKRLSQIGQEPPAALAERLQQVKTRALNAAAADGWRAATLRADLVVDGTEEAWRWFIEHANDLDLLRHAAGLLEARAAPLAAVS